MSKAPANRSGCRQASAADIDPGMAFEQALAEVESIVDRLEAGEIGLEDALAQYERGVGLINLCRARLDNAQQKVEDLTKRLEKADNEGPDGGAGER